MPSSLFCSLGKFVASFGDVYVAEGKWWISPPQQMQSTSHQMSPRYWKSPTGDRAQLSIQEMTHLICCIGV